MKKVEEIFILDKCGFFFLDNHQFKWDFSGGIKSYMIDIIGKS